jgi:nucleotide-binding universal stress UspA family protein
MNYQIRQFAVHLDGSARGDARLAIALRLAFQHGVSLAAVYASVPAFSQLPRAPELGPALLASLWELEDQRRKAAWERFCAAVQGRGLHTDWSEILLPPLVPEAARVMLYADMMVLGQHDPHDALASGVPADFPESLMAACGKPALVIPYITPATAEVGNRITIAWNETRQCASAVAASLPLLQTATQVDVLQWLKPDRPPRQGGLNLSMYLKSHGVEARFHQSEEEPAQIGELILSRAADFESDLLVMGCYGHGRAREWVLGGASRTVLRAMTIPVLMAH